MRFSAYLGQWRQPWGLLCLLSLIHILNRRNVPVGIIPVSFSLFYSNSFSPWKYKSMHKNIANPPLSCCLYIPATAREMLHAMNQLRDGRPIRPALAADSRSAAQRVPCMLWSLKVHHHCHKRPALNPSPLHTRNYAVSAHQCYALKWFLRVSCVSQSKRISHYLKCSTVNVLPISPLFMHV